MWYSRLGETRVERRDHGYRNTWRRLLWDLSSLPPWALLVSLAVWTGLLWSITPDYAPLNPASQTSVKRCNAAPVLLTRSAPDFD